jgi:hypothetical protein
MCVLMKRLHALSFAAMGRIAVAAIAGLTGSSGVKGRRSDRRGRLLAPEKRMSAQASHDRMYTS